MGVELACSLALVPLPRLGYARHLRSTHHQGCVCVWEGGRETSSSRRVGEGGQSYTHPIVSRLGRAQVSSTPHPHSRRFCLRLNVAFGLMSFGLMSPSA